MESGKSEGKEARWQDAITVTFRALVKRVGLTQRGRGFYTLRRVFRTIADETGDWPAVNMVMGHTDPTIGGVYRQRIDDNRLKAVADHVRAWLFGQTEGGAS
jgi:integrase